MPSCNKLPVASSLIFGLLALAGILRPASAVQADETESAAVDFVRDVQPIFKARCVACHGPETAESDLRLDIGRRVADGGGSGPAVVPGKSGESLLIERVTATDAEARMPPDGEPLTPQPIATLKAWIDRGAEVPAVDAAEEDLRLKHWSFQPIDRPALPSVRDGRWVRNPIDRFVLARLEAESIAPSPPADPIILLKRVSLDLTGLAPTPAEIERVLGDARPGAYQRYVDRLLASPHYGERWGRHWLDRARYADSDGYTNDVPREIWPYRDWVIDALNRDLPFDQFTIEQIAGDLLPSATESQKVATGFHRNTQHNREGGSDAEQYRVERVVDRVSTTGSVFLGLTIGCARCHEHKFDPISHRDFYEFYAFFNNSEEPKLSLASDRQQQRLAQIKSALAELGQRAADRSLGKAEREELKQKIAQLQKQEKSVSQQIPTTLVMQERSRPRETYIHLRGNFLSRGRTVTADVLSALPPLPAAVDNPDRLDLARWLVSRENPLTARVIVNRMWQTYFGRGLVETDSDFGLQGTPPSHPKLLDYLASEFIQRGWSRKAMHRLIVTSAVYRQSSRERTDLETIDPNNRLLARQSRHRLEAEIIRDRALQAAGLLSYELGGPGVYPPQPEGVMKLARNPNRKWNTSSGNDRYRRGVYTYFWRGTPYPFLKAFDAPDSNSTCTRRNRSNTPLQALMLLNAEAFFEAAQALAGRMLAEPDLADRARLQKGFELCLLRQPSDAELATLTRLLAQERADAESLQPLLPTPAMERMPEQIELREQVAWVSVARVLLNLDEFITRE